MLIDTNAVSRWYVLNQNFKAYKGCPKCNSSNIEYHKVRMTGYRGIAAQCIECGKALPIRFKPDHCKEIILKAN